MFLCREVRGKLIFRRRETGGEAKNYAGKNYTASESFFESL